MTADGQLGQVLLAGIDDGEDFVSSNPYLVAVPVLRHDLEVTDGLEQCGGQVVDGFASLAGVFSACLAMYVFQPELSVLALAYFGDQWQRVDQLLALFVLIEPYAVRFAGIYLVAVHEHGGGGVRRHSADGAVRPNLVDAAGGGDEQSVAGVAHGPADIADFRNAPALSVGDAEESVGAADIYFAVIGRDGMHLAGQAVLGQQVAVYRRHLDGEYSVCRGSPEHAVSVVGDVGHLVGTEAVGLGDGIQGMILVVGDDESKILLDLGFESAVQFLRLGDVFEEGIPVAFLQCLHRYNIRLHADTEVGVGALLGYYGRRGLLVDDLIDDVVAGYKL